MAEKYGLDSSAETVAIALLLKQEVISGLIIYDT